jgi:hypothetical protein
MNSERTGQIASVTDYIEKVNTFRQKSAAKLPVSDAADVSALACRTLLIPLMFTIN